MSYFSWTRASYVMFGLAVFAALIKLWSPDISGSESLAAEQRTNEEAPRVSVPSEKQNTEKWEPPILEIPDPERESFVRHEALPSIGEEASGDPETSEPANEPPVFFRPAREARQSRGSRAAAVGLDRFRDARAVWRGRRRSAHLSGRRRRAPQLPPRPATSVTSSSRGHPQPPSRLRVRCGR